MNIKKYFYEIKERIKYINEFISNSNNYRDLNNPFAATLSKTYVWIDEEN